MPSIRCHRRNRRTEERTKDDTTAFTRRTSRTAVIVVDVFASWFTVVDRRKNGTHFSEQQTRKYIETMKLTCERTDDKRRRLYAKGIEGRRAEPLDVLRKRQAHFMRRMRRQWINRQIEVSFLLGFLWLVVTSRSCCLFCFFSFRFVSSCSLSND